MKHAVCKNRKINVLMVEDEEIAQDIGKAVIVHELNFYLDVAENGHDGLRLAHDKRYDLILMDLGLLDIDGFTVAETIHREDSKNSRTPIIALTAHADRSFQARAARLGFATYIVKPLTKANFQQVVKECLGHCACSHE